ncbi:hypothetical protein BH23PSE2_BH23PSE2_05060 [soil metagenome]
MPDLPRSAAGRMLRLALLLSCSAPALAAGELGLGASITEDHETTAVVAASWLPPLRDLDHALLRAELGAIHVRGRGRTPGQDLRDDVLVAFAGLRYERRDNGLTLGAGIGAQAGETEALSGGPQFVTSVGWRWPPLTVLVRHISNAGLRNPNGGETMLLGSWRFR